MTNGLPRRGFLGSCALTLTALLTGGWRGASHSRLAWAPGPDDPPEIPNDAVRDAIRLRFGDRPVRTGHVSLDMPQVAEDGRTVPVIIESDLPMAPDNYVKGVHLFVDHNPDVHVAGYELTPAIGRVSITTRIKMRRSCWVRAMIETSGGDVWAGYANVKVTLNGCG